MAEVESGWDCGSAEPSVCSINGCTKAMAMANDKTGDDPVALGDPLALTYPYCVTVKQNVDVTVTGTGAQGGPLIVGGYVENGSKVLDSFSPIQPLCAEQYDPAALAQNAIDGNQPDMVTDICPSDATASAPSGDCMPNASACVKMSAAQPCCFSPNSGANNTCYDGGCWAMPAGVYPFYDNGDVARLGAIWVVP